MKENKKRAPGNTEQGTRAKTKNMKMFPVNAGHEQKYE